MERVLYRLSKSPYRTKFVLKGALMFNVWEAPLSRPTMDIDLLGMTRNSIDDLVTAIQNLCLQDVAADGLTFDEKSVDAERIIEDADYEGVRIRFRGTLDTARFVIQLDVAFGDVIIPSAFSIIYPTILDMPAPKLRGYSRESTVSEKFEAMVKLGVLNSRMKDFYDIWLLSRQFDFDGRTLATAIIKTFSQRGTEIPSQPVALTDRFSADPSKSTQWRGFVRKNLLDNIPENFHEVITAVGCFLGPIADALAAGRAFEETWNAPGPWSGHSGKDS